ncbi:MAG: N-formylglutamate amidohydrolase, partial [Alphaproteobacteria bacterium]|nr:N-formylglutamate amidohydrolase [Alphaproteobacteria bacterium]
TRNYGRPAGGIHALQIEIKRSLYMDERRIERLPRLRQMTGHMRRLIGDLAKLDRDVLMPPR